MFPAESFDAVTLWELLDHVPHPRPLLKLATKILKTGGVMLVAVRNSESLAARILQEKCHVFNGSGHYQLFSVENLKQMCAAVGLVPYHHEDYISELGIINNYLDYLDPYAGQGALPVLGFLTDEYILTHDLGYKILLVAQKASR